MYFSDDIAPAEPASSVIPVRRSETGGIEVYMTRRRESLEFLGGFYVFPGGKVDAGDCCDEVLKRCAGLSPSRACEVLGGGLDPVASMGYWVAGLRELFEEAGVLLAYRQDGSVPDFNVKDIREKFDAYRAKLQNCEITFTEMIVSENLRLATDRLYYLSHWVTPPGPRRRFDTRFFVAEVPEVQRPRFFEGEVSDGMWISPAEAIRKARREELPIILPTYLCLSRVTEFSSVDEIRSLPAGGK